MKTHKDLIVWQKAMDFVEEVYKLTDTMPKSELYGLTSQIRRSAVSIPSNIAEGAARFSPKEFSQFLNIGGGSLSELDTQMEIAMNLGYISDQQKQDFDLKIDSISAKLAGLINSVRNRAKKSD